MGKSDLPFYCLHCSILLHNQEITKLKGQVTELTAKLDSITLSGKENVNVSFSAQQTTNNNPTASSILVQSQQSNFQPADCKFNLVIAIWY